MAANRMSNRAILLLGLPAASCSQLQSTSRLPHSQVAADWSVNAPYAPTFQVLNTESSLGPYASAYLGGGRIRFGSQKIDPSLGIEFWMHRFSTGETVRLRLRDGVLPVDLKPLEKHLKSGLASADDLRRCQQMQWQFALQLLSVPAEQSFVVEKIADFQWQADAYPNAGIRSDIQFKTAR